VRQAEIIEATSTDNYTAGRILIEEYAATLGVDLCFQNFLEEIENLSKIYGAPRGCLLLARVNGECIGCVAVRYQGDAVCEMKRLYVQPQYRGTGIGRHLAESAIRCARQLNYSRIVLDTLPSMTEAQSLYGSLGFREVEGYYANPLRGVRYLVRDLTSGEPNIANEN